MITHSTMTKTPNQWGSVLPTKKSHDAIWCGKPYTENNNTPKNCALIKHRKKLIVCVCNPQSEEHCVAYTKRYSAHGNTAQQGSGLTSQRNMNMPMWSCSSRVTLSARRSVLPSGSKSSSRLRAPFLSWVHTSISSWQYANVQFSPYWHSCRSCTSVCV